jgi:hypothetical protein
MPEKDKPKTKEYLLISLDDLNRLDSLDALADEIRDDEIRDIVRRIRAYKCRVVCAEHPREE